MTAIPLTCPDCGAALVWDRWFSTGLAKIRVPWVRGIFVDQGTALECPDCSHRIESCLSEAEEVQQAKVEKKRTIPPEAEVEAASWMPNDPWAVADHLADILPRPGSTWRFYSATRSSLDVRVTKLTWAVGRLWVVYTTMPPGNAGEQRVDLGTWMKHATWISDAPKPDPASIVSNCA